MRNTFKVLFYVKRSALLRNGKAPIMGRITINKQRAQFSTRLSVDPRLWDVKLGRIAGRGSEAAQINEQLSVIRFHIEKCYYTLFYAQTLVTPIMVKEMFFGVNHQYETLLFFFRKHNEEFSRMVGVSRSKTTYYKYRCVYNHLENYINEKYKRKDLMFKELNREFLSGFHSYIAVECEHKKNTTWIYMIALKHILMLARSNGYLSKDLFANYKLNSEFVQRNYLSLNEINKIIECKCDTPTLQLVRDAFLFSCFTGLSYIDIRDLTLKNVRKVDDRLWVTTIRRKTGAEVNVRLLTVPYHILLNNTPISDDQPIFPLPSNGWCNASLNKIMEMTGINKQITFHAARHTFATTITLSQGVGIETISKLLGHKNIRTTQIYANITQSQLSGEMARLSKRLKSVCRSWTPDNLSEMASKCV